MASFCFMPLLKVPAVADRRSHRSSRQVFLHLAFHIRGVIEPCEDLQIVLSAEAFIMTRRFGQNADLRSNLLAGAGDGEA